MLGTYFIVGYFRTFSGLKKFRYMLYVGVDSARYVSFVHQFPFTLPCVACLVERVPIQVEEGRIMFVQGM